mmetsp:Transcript_34507/g.70599  ORF Transcript_34507/g.70599 Transcript_34507/m.70599 type:complete len:215 (+) Transcript_34507:92-736(+)
MEVEEQENTTTTMEEYRSGPTSAPGATSHPSMNEPWKRPRPRTSSLCKPTRPGEMIEEWPTSLDGHLHLKKSVSFSEFSAMYPYEKTYTPVNELFYTSSERKFMSKRDTVQEAIRIRRALSDGMDASGEDIPTLAQCGLKGHELVGIEHLVLHKVPKNISKLRKHHSQMVLQEQEKQRAVYQNDPVRLAAESAIDSKKSSLQARKRADIAFSIK